MKSIEEEMDNIRKKMRRKAEMRIGRISLEKGARMRFGK